MFSRKTLSLFWTTHHVVWKHFKLENTSWRIERLHYQVTPCLGCLGVVVRGLTKPWDFPGVSVGSQNLKPSPEGAMNCLLVELGKRFITNTWIITFTPFTKLTRRQNITINIVFSGSIFSISSVQYVAEHLLRRKAAPFRIFDCGHYSPFSETSEQSVSLRGHRYIYFQVWISCV